MSKLINFHSIEGKWLNAHSNFDKWCIFLIESFIYQRRINDNYIGVYRFNQKHGLFVEQIEYSQYNSTSRYSRGTYSMNKKQGKFFVLTSRSKTPSSSLSHSIYEIVNNKDQYWFELTVQTYELGKLHGECLTFVSIQDVVTTFFDTVAMFEPSVFIGGLIKRENYSLDVKQGRVKEWFGSQKLKQSMNYTRGKLSGIKVEYYESLPMRVQEKFDFLKKRTIEYLSEIMKKGKKSEFKVLNRLKKEEGLLKKMTYFTKNLREGYEVCFNWKDVFNFSGSRISSLPREERIQIVIYGHSLEKCEVSEQYFSSQDRVWYFE